MGQNDQAAEHLAKARALRARYYDLAAAREFQAAAEGAAPSADLLIEWGQCLGSQEDWEGAIEKYEQAAALDPNRSDAYLFWGGALESLGEPEEAADRYQAAATRDPHNSSAYLGLADAYSKQGRWSEAIQTYARAIEIDSDNVGGLVAALEELGGDEKAKAIEGLDARFGAHPQYARTLTSWGQVLTWDDKHIEASERYRKAASIDPTFQPGRIELGKALLQMGQIRDAAASLIEAIPLDVTSFSDFETLDEALAKLTPGDTAEASNKLRRAFTNAATMAEFYVAWGDDLARRDRHDEAITRYKTALEDDPRSAGAHLGLGDVLAQQKKYKAAAEMYGQAAKAHPRSASAFSRWGDALASDGRHAESAKRYRQALAIDPTAVEASHLLALLAKVEPHEKAVTLDVLSRSLARSADPAAYLRWGDELRAAARFEEAGKQYEQAALLSRHQGNKALEQRAYFQWGYLLLGRWNWPDAIDKFAKAPEEFAEPDIHLNWGWALFKMRRYDDAIQHYQQVLNTDATDAGAHHYWGLALAEQRRHSEAIEHYERALALRPANTRPYLDWGNALEDQGRVGEAIEVTQRAAAIDGKDAYFRHNIASFLSKLGRYDASRAGWDTACQLYERNREEKGKAGDADYFNYYGSVLHDFAGDLAKSEQVLGEGLTIDPEHAGILSSLLSTCLERHENPPDGEGDDRFRDREAFGRAREYFLKAERILKGRVTFQDASALQDLGDLYLSMGQLDDAKTCYEQASKEDPESAALYVCLGVVYSRKEDFRQAAQCFEQARQRNRHDLNMWSNLAEAYLKLDQKSMSQISKAEGEFKKILMIAPQHIDSLIGLGQVYTAMAELGEDDAYEVAIKQYGEAIDLAERAKGSKRLKPKELAAVHYSRGYARVKLYESSKPFGDESLLRDALRDFDRCSGLDCDHYKAERAKTKVNKRLNKFSGRWVGQKAAPFLVLVPALFVLFMTQGNYFFGHPALQKPLDLAAYIALTFGSLIFVVVGLFLPEIQKLKGAGIELEKGAVTQISTSASLGISK